MRRLTAGSLRLSDATQHGLGDLARDERVGVWLLPQRLSVDRAGQNAVDRALPRPALASEHMDETIDGRSLAL
jgi:hypothetical protein